MGKIVNLIIVTVVLAAAVTVPQILANMIF